MGVKYLVTQVETCPKCAGKKFVQHPAWEEYWEANLKDGRAMSYEEDIKWFEDHGWLPGNSFETGIDGLPDENILCGECEAEGVIVKEVNLLDILPALIDAVRNAEVSGVMVGVSAQEVK